MTSPTSGSSGLPELSQATSGISSTSSFSTTPRPPPKPEESLSALFKAAGYSPPEKADTIFQSDVATRAHQVLKTISKSWTDLDEIQQAKLAFLLMHGQENRLYYYVTAADTAPAMRTAMILWKACTDESDPHFSKLDTYVRKGGDQSWGENNEFDQNRFFTEFSEFNPDQDPEKVATLFYNPCKEGCSIEPVLRLQEEKSTICYIVSVVTAIFYSQCLKQGGTQNNGIKSYSLNVNRFMRNYFTDEEIFENIFRNQGGWPHLILRRLLEGSNPGKMVSMTKDFEPTAESNVNLTFRVIKTNLMQHGALIIHDFPLFPEFVDDVTLVFSGDWKDKEKCPGFPPHALLVVGARLTGDSSEMGGLALLLQNSWKGKPFVVVGYDLLKSMGIHHFTVVNKDLNFSMPDNCSIAGEPSNSIMSGSSPITMSSGNFGESSNFFFGESVCGQNTPKFLFPPGNGSIVSEPVSSVSTNSHPPLTDASYYWNIANPNDKSGDES